MKRAMLDISCDAGTAMDTPENWDETLVIKIAAYEQEQTYIDSEIIDNF